MLSLWIEWWFVESLTVWFQALVSGHARLLLPPSPSWRRNEAALVSSLTLLNSFLSHLWNLSIYWSYWFEFSFFIPGLAFFCFLSPFQSNLNYFFKISVLLPLTILSCVEIFWYDAAFPFLFHTSLFFTPPTFPVSICCVVCFIFLPCNVTFESWSIHAIIIIIIIDYDGDSFSAITSLQSDWWTFLAHVINLTSGDW